MNELTMWQLYWVLKLDDIITVLRAVSVFAGVAVLFFLAMFIESNEAYFRKLCVRTAIGACLSLFVALMLPSTKQMAAMYIIPELVSSENIDALSKESRELYNLAKQALEKAVGDEGK